MRPQYIAAVIVVAGGLTGLTACTWLANTFGPTPSAQTQTDIVHGVLAACNTYKIALEAATVAQNAGKFSAQQVAEIHAVRPGIEGICPPKGAMPTNLTSALVIIAEGTATIVSDTKAVNP